MMVYFYYTANDQGHTNDRIQGTQQVYKHNIAIIIVAKLDNLRFKTLQPP